MGYTSKTPTLELPQWSEFDRPNWDIDTNKAFSLIDDFAKETLEKEDTLDAQVNNHEGQLTAIKSTLVEVNALLHQTNELANTNASKITTLEEKQTQTESDVSNLDVSMSSVLNVLIPNLNSSVTEANAKSDLAIENSNNALQGLAGKQDKNFLISELSIDTSIATLEKGNAYLVGWNGLLAICSWQVNSSGSSGTGWNWSDIVGSMPHSFSSDNLKLTIGTRTSPLATHRFVMKLA